MRLGSFLAGGRGDLHGQEVKKREDFCFEPRHAALKVRLRGAKKKGKLVEVPRGHPDGPSVHEQGLKFG